jgi:predicted RNA-binding Zn-ribbon protein involved in translation (DUF1610 family)
LNNTFIRSSKHTLSFTNKGKLNDYSTFLKEYRRVLKLYVDYIWLNALKFTFNKKDGKTVYKHFNLETNNFELPTMLSNPEIDKAIQLETFLTARALKCCLTQSVGIVRGVVEKKRKQQWAINSLRSHNKKIPVYLRRAVGRKITKPDVSAVNPEINSVCIDFQEGCNFDLFMSLKSVVSDKDRGFRINLPIKHHKRSRKWESNGELLNSVLLCDNDIELRWEVEKKLPKIHGKSVGADQGMNTLLVLAASPEDHQSTDEFKDIHGHTVSKICKKLNRKHNGSKAFKQTVAHRKNHINCMLNQLDFTGIKQINLEHFSRLRYKQKSKGYLDHWVYPFINEKIARRCEEEEVLLVHDNNVYYSQRCSRCGMVLKSNRSGKVYFCKNCGLELDADLNSALNHQQNLPPVPWGLKELNLNRTGFFWRSDGFFSLTGEELTVPLYKNNAII